MAKLKFKIELFRGCEIFAKLTIKKNTGFLTYWHYDFKNCKQELTTNLFESVDKKVIEMLVKQAELICIKNYSILSSY